MSVNVFRIDAIATMIGISTAGSVPNTNRRITSAPAPPISASVITLGPDPPEASCSASRPVRCTWTPGGASRCRSLRTSAMCVLALKPCCPGR